MDFKKKAQCESFESSFSWGNKRQHLRQLRETVSDMQEKDSMYVILVKGQVKTKCESLSRV